LGFTNSEPLNDGTTVEAIQLSAIRKEYKRPFILEETKLTSVLEVIHDCLDSPGVVTKDRFEVFVGRDRVEEATTLEEVLGTPNSRENPIHRLVLTSSAPAPSPGHGSHEIEIDFDAEAMETSPTPSGPMRKITVVIRSDAPGWARRTLSAVEEQVDRTRFDDLGHRGALAVIVLLLMILIAGLLASSVRIRSSPEQIMWLTDADIHQLAKSLEPNKTLTEEQVREIVTMQLRNVVSDFGEPTGTQIQSSPTSKSSGLVGALLLVGPLVALIATAIYLLVHCYPTALFLWGDAIGRYEHLKHTRTILWPIIVGAAVVGLLTNAFRAGVLSYLAQH
jgi:hypothetical protein